MKSGQGRDVRLGRVLPPRALATAMSRGAASATRCRAWAGASPSCTSASRSGTRPGSRRRARPARTSFITGDRGVHDGHDAIARNRRGLSARHGDLPRHRAHERITPAMRSITRRGRRRCSRTAATARLLHACRQRRRDLRRRQVGVRRRRRHHRTAVLDRRTTKIFTVDKMPTDVGHTFAAVWQGLLDVTRTHSGIRLPVDINVRASFAVGWRTRRRDSTSLARHRSASPAVVIKFLDARCRAALRSSSALAFAASTLVQDAPDSRSFPRRSRVSFAACG